MSRLRPGSLQPSELVVFDTGGADKLRETVLAGLPHFTLDCRIQTLHASAGLLGRSLLNAARLGSTRPGQLYTAYLLACLQQLRPRVVLTHVDNNVYFQSLSALYPRAVFIAVQNGFRSEVSVARPSQVPGGWLPEKPAPGSVIRLPHFFCFGRFEQDLYMRLGHDVGSYHPAGSLRAGYYKSELSPGEPPVEHDVCLVSEWDAAIMEQGLYPHIRRGVERLNEHLARYVSERPLRLSVAGRSRDERERRAYEELFGGKAVFVPNDPAAYSSYALMDRSDVVVSLYSTAAFEAFGWGRKTLFCNLSGDPTLSCPVPGPWSLTEGGYEEFRARLDALLARGRRDFREESAEAARYLMAYDPARPAHRRLRALVESVLEGKPA